MRTRCLSNATHEYIKMIDVNEFIYKFSHFNNNIPALHLDFSNDYYTLFTIQRLHILRNSQVNNLSSKSQMILTVEQNLLEIHRA